MKKCTKIKICGVTNCADACSIARIGVDYIGVIYDFPLGKRSTTRERLIEISNAIRQTLKNQKTKLVAVCVDKSKEELKDIQEYVDIIQLHGRESPEFVRDLKKDLDTKIWKALKVSSQSDLDDILKYKGLVDEILLDAGDSRDKQMQKNTSLNIELIKKVQEVTKMNFIVAGRIGLDNVEEIDSVLKPRVLDLSSKVEINPRKKDIKLIKEIFRKICQN